MTHRAIVKDVLETDKMSEDESKDFVNKYSKQLNLAKHQYERWAVKKYLCLIEIEYLDPIEPFIYRRDNNMDDWIITDDINKIKA